MKKIMSRMANVAFFFLLGLVCLNGQNAQESKNIRYQYDAKNQPTGFVFLDEKTGDKVAQFDFLEHSPFEKYEFPSVETNALGAKAYDLSGLTNREIRNRFNLPISDEQIDQPLFGKAETYWSTTISGDYCAVSFLLRFSEKESGFFGVMSTGFVLNNKGRVVFAIPVSFDGDNELALTADGKALAVMAGGMPSEVSFDFYTNPCLKIYDLKKKGKVYKINSANAPSALGHYIVFTNRTLEAVEYGIVDCSAQKIYTRTYAMSEFSGAKYFEDKGFIWMNDDGTTLKKHLWEKDFKVSNSIPSYSNNDLIKASSKGSIGYRLNESGYPAFIDFHDEQGKKMYTFDLQANNPFKSNLPMVNVYGQDCYKVDDLDYSFRDAHAKMDILPKEDLGNIRIDRFFSICKTDETAYDNYTLAAYTNFYLSDWWGLCGWETKVYVLNKLGKITDSLHLKGEDCSQMRVSADGKYIAYNNGALYNLAENPVQREKAKIMDLRTRKIIYENDEAFINGDATIAFVGKDTALAVGQVKAQLYNYQILLLQERKIYQKEYPIQKGLELRSFPNCLICMKKDDGQWLPVNWKKEFSVGKF